MLIINDFLELRTVVKEFRQEGRRIGFVPTMGALHDGHATLIQQSSSVNDVTVVSIFVNHTQFNVQSDFDKYPRTFETDIQLAENSGATVIFAPDSRDMYPAHYRTFIEPGQSADPMEGEGRPGHFRGVATVVVKLLNLVQPDVAYFGKKDFQQLAVVRETIDSLNIPVTIEGVETVRETDGLALSSRNVRLSDEARKQAPVIYRSLMKVREAYLSGERNTRVLEGLASDELHTQSLCRVEYATVCDVRTLRATEVSSDHAVLCIAVWFDDVRLIDNIELISTSN